jgi:hypothetical protein
MGSAAGCSLLDQLGDEPGRLARDFHAIARLRP